MVVGVAKEVKDHESRVGLTPSGAVALKEAGHKVLVETHAGEGSSIPDSEYVAAGAEIMPAAGEVWAKSDIVVKVKEPQPSEYGNFRPGLILFTYLHLAPLPELTGELLKSKVTGVAYETILESDGTLPLLTPMSEVAGRMSVQVGAQYLEKPNGGRGILLGGVPGTAPANVVILGGGIVGTNAAKMALGLGAHVTMIDRNLHRLRQLDDIFNGQLVTLASNPLTIGETLKTADLAIGAVLIPGASAPKLVKRSQVAAMKRGAVIVDVAIDQGGCFRDGACDHPHGTDLLCRQRAALLRVKYAGGGAAHVNFCAYECDVPVPARNGEQGPAEGVPGAQRAVGRREHLQWPRDL